MRKKQTTDKNRRITVLLMAVFVSIAIREFSIANCDAKSLILSLESRIRHASSVGND
jgi:hypothetical protein